ncbi:FliM/FliN family flagellar motor switch protein [Solimonas sp. SE-A11]|uniref:FliM/FliN family flagellar motor switch protein n=1 Tax=Solimonas sp. SE-A11 TaxID=3054954 RepID=UPI00259CC792|nr:FliM/FliN family flagellar motor switch protein [Solimonas sp. SE-A11]MDM4772921.1 FliM/FliN family flagellar motor switch protein [Solimonas sp. SE-A11]
MTQVNEQPEIQPLKLGELGAGAGRGQPWLERQLDLVRDIKVTVRASMGSAELTIASLFALREGDVVTLDRETDAPVDITLEGNLIARGQLVAAGDRFGLRITEILDPGKF